jgi:phosphotransferase system IIA component
MRRAITTNGERAISIDFQELSRTAVDNVTNIVVRQRKTNTIIDEWMAANEASKKWSLRK